MSEECMTSWVSGFSDLTSYCLSEIPGVFSGKHPSILDIVALRAKDSAPPSPVNREVWAHPLNVSDAEMKGVGPNNENVSWPMTPGDVLWAGTTADIDSTRHFGVYIGGGTVVDMGLGRRQVHSTGGQPYWAHSLEDPERERAKVVTLPEFTGMGSLRCGVLNKHACQSRAAILRYAVESIGILLKRLAHPDAHHLAIFIATNTWLVDSPRSAMRRSVQPTSMSGRFARPKQYKNPGYTVGSSTCRVSFREDGEVEFSFLDNGGFELVLPIDHVAEELGHQQNLMQPFHEPITGYFLSEDDVATIILTDSEQRAKI